MQTSISKGTRPRRLRRVNRVAVVMVQRRRGGSGEVTIRTPLRLIWAAAPECEAVPVAG